MNFPLLVARPVLPRLVFLLLMLVLAGPGRGWAQAPAWAQAVSFNPGRVGGTSECRGVATDAAGNQYLAGSYEDTLALANAPVLTATGRTLLVVKRSATGAWLWVVQPGSSDLAAGSGVAVDAGGNVVVTGTFRGTVRFDTGAAPIVLSSPGLNNVFVAKLSGSTGACLWAVQTSGSGSATGTEVVVDAGGDALVTGTFSGTTRFVTSPAPTALTAAAFGDVFVAKFGSSTGACAWAVQTRSSTSQYPSGLAVDAGGNALVAGYFVGTLSFGPAPAPAAMTSAGLQDGFVAKFGAATGTCVWAVQVGSSGVDYAGGVAADAAGNVLLTGGFEGPVSFATRPAPTVLVSSGGRVGFVAKLAASTGACAWAVPASAGGNVVGSGVAADANGNAVVLGSFCGTTRFATPSAPALLRAPAGCGAFVARYGAAAGACAWAVPAGGGGNSSIAVDGGGRAVLVGFFRDTAVFGNLTLIGSRRVVNGTAFGVYAGFVAVLSNAGTLATATPAALPAFALFPNPARRACQVQGTAAGAEVTVHDALGRPLARTVADGRGTARLALPAGLAPGLYLVRSGGQVQRLAVE